MSLPSVLPAPPAPKVRLSLGITGHRETNAEYAANHDRIAATLGQLLDLITACVGATSPPFGEPFAPVRLNSMLANGADQLAADEALMRGWDLVVPLPFGRSLNCAVNALPADAGDARALLAGTPPADAATARRAGAISRLCDQARLFELADDDDEIRPAFLAMLDAPLDSALADAFKADASVRVALAARLVIEQSDLMIAIWDGTRTSFAGGTGHTVMCALNMGANVIWINPAEPEAWRILNAPEALASLSLTTADPGRDAHVQRLVRAALLHDDDAAPAAELANGHHGVAALDGKHWRPQSQPLWHAYRRVEAVFGWEKGQNPWRSLRQSL